MKIRADGGREVLGLVSIFLQTGQVTVPVEVSTFVLVRRAIQVGQSGMVSLLWVGELC